MRAADFRDGEGSRGRNQGKKMDFNSLQNYLTSLGLLYVWTLFAAGAFALGERFCRGLFAQKQPVPSDAKDPAKS
jgi:hypothetical protein